MNSLLVGIGVWIKSNVIASIVIGTVVVGGAIATPIIIDTYQENQNLKKEIKENKKNDENKNQITCEAGFIFNEEGICVEITEDMKDDEGNLLPEYNTKTDNSDKNNDKQNNNSTKPNNNCTDITCLIDDNGIRVLYNGKELFKMTTVNWNFYFKTMEVFSYNSSNINSVPKEHLKYIYENHFMRNYHTTSKRDNKSYLYWYNETISQLSDSNKNHYQGFIDNANFCISTFSDADMRADNTYEYTFSNQATGQWIKTYNPNYLIDNGIQGNLIDKTLRCTDTNSHEGFRSIIKTNEDHIADNNNWINLAKNSKKDLNDLIKLLSNY